MEREGQAAAATSGASGPAILKALEDMLVSLRRSSKDLSFYPPGHPLLNRSLENAVEQIQAVVGTRAPLALAVSRSGFSFEGQPVGKENRQLATMAAELFVRRIQKIFFLREIGMEELAAFLRMIGSDPKQLAQEGGPAKVLAAHRVGRIQVNEFDFRRVGAGQAAAPAATEVASPPAAAASKVPPAGQAAALQSGQAPSPPEKAAEILPLPSKGTEERTGQGQTVEESLVTSPGTHKELTVGTLIQRLEQEAASAGSPGYEWAASRLEKAAGRAIQDDSLKDIVAILGVFLRHRRADNLKASLRERSARAVETIAGDDTVSYLVEHLRTEAGGSTEELSEVLVDLGAPVIPRLLRRLATEEQDGARLWIVATLARLHEMVQADVELALRTLDSDEACQLVPILAEIGGASTGTTLLACLLRHRDARVRTEVVQRLGRIGEPAAHRLLLQTLRDPDPSVLELVVGFVGAAKLKLALPTLLRLAKQRSLTGKTFDVRKAAMAALGAMGDPGTVQTLRRVLYTRTWLQRKAGDELRQAAALALLAMARPEAHEVVEAGARSRRRQVRRACSAALQSVGGAASAQE